MLKEQPKIETSPEKKEEIEDEELELEKRLQSIGSDKETEIMAKIAEMRKHIRKGEQAYEDLLSEKKIRKDLGKIFRMKEGALFLRGKMAFSTDALEDVKLTDKTMCEIYGKARAALSGASNKEEELDPRVDHVSNAIKYLRSGGYLKREWIVKKLEDLGEEHPRLARTIHDTITQRVKKW